MTDKEPRQRKLVRDLMAVGVPTCPEETSLLELTRLCLEKELEAVVVLDQYGHAAGYVSWDELVAAYGQETPAEQPVEAIMRPGLPQVPPDIPLTVAAQIMQDQGVRVLFLTHHAGGIEYPAAMLTYRHLLRHLAVENDDDLADLGVRAERDNPMAAFMRRRDEARRRAGLDR